MTKELQMTSSSIDTQEDPTDAFDEEQLKRYHRNPREGNNSSVHESLANLRFDNPTPSGAPARNLWGSPDAFPPSFPF